MVNPIVVYCYPVRDFIDQAANFLHSFHLHQPGIEHRTIIVTNGSGPSSADRAMFSSLPNLRFFEHDNSGWDIGAFQEVSQNFYLDMMFCLGTNTTFRRSGWLRRIVDVWNDFGPGLYGTLASLQYGVPHFATTGFACPGWLIANYPRKISSHADRSEFEHGKENLTVFAEKLNLPVKLVTWSGVWEKKDFRTPANGLNSGDQSDCMVNYTQTDIYDHANRRDRQTLHKRVSGLCT